MEFAFIVGVFGIWIIIAMVKCADWLRDKDSKNEESDHDFLNRVARENSERARKQLEEIKKSKQKCEPNQYTT